MRKNTRLSVSLSKTKTTSLITMSKNSKRTAMTRSKRMTTMKSQKKKFSPFAQWDSLARLIKQTLASPVLKTTIG